MEQIVNKGDKKEKCNEINMRETEAVAYIWGHVI